MKRKIPLIVIAVVFFAAVAGCVTLMLIPQKSTVNIISGGKVIETVDLITAENRIFDIEYNGSVNTIEISDGKIRVLSAECPDKTCVKMGWLSSAAAPIVCLPNHLVIEFAGGNGMVDAVSE